MHGENAFKDRQVGIVSFSLLVMILTKLVLQRQWGNCGYFLTELDFYKHTHILIPRTLIWHAFTPDSEGYCSVMCEKWSIMEVTLGAGGNVMKHEESLIEWLVSECFIVYVVSCYCWLPVVYTRSKVQFMLGSHRRHIWLILRTCNISGDKVVGFQ